MRAWRTLGRWGVAAAALVSLLGAAPAPKQALARPAAKKEIAPALQPGPLTNVRPPTDPAAYDAVLERVRRMPPEEAFGFAAFDHQLPVENLGRQTQPGTLRMASLTLRIPAEVAFDAYRVAFSKKYLPLYQGRFGPNSAYLSFRDASDGFMRTVTVTGTDSTVVIVAISDPERLLHRGPAAADHAPADWPLPPVLGSPADLETEEMGVFQRTRAVEVACTDSAEPLSFFDTHLPEKGWQPVKEGRVISRESSRQDFRRGEELCAVTSLFRTGQPCGLSIICTARN